MLSNKLFNPIRVLRPSDFAKALSTLPSISEISEALEYVGETDKKLVTTVSIGLYPLWVGYQPAFSKQTNIGGGP